MKLSDVLSALEAGKSIRQRSWADGRYMNVGGSTVITVARDALIADNWEVVEEPPKLHTFEEATKAHGAGRRVARKEWAGWVLPGDDYRPTISDMAATDWIIEEP